MYDAFEYFLPSIRRQAANCKYDWEGYSERGLDPFEECYARSYGGRAITYFFNDLKRLSDRDRERWWRQYWEFYRDWTAAKIDNLEIAMGLVEEKKPVYHILEYFAPDIRERVRAKVWEGEIELNQALLEAARAQFDLDTETLRGEPYYKLAQPLTKCFYPVKRSHDNYADVADAVKAFYENPTLMDAPAVGMNEPATSVGEFRVPTDCRVDFGENSSAFEKAVMDLYVYKKLAPDVGWKVLGILDDLERHGIK